MLKMMCNMRPPDKVQFGQERSSREMTQQGDDEVRLLLLQHRRVSAKKSTSVRCQSILEHQTINGSATLTLTANQLPLIGMPRKEESTAGCPIQGDPSALNLSNALNASRPCRLFDSFDQQTPTAHL